METDYSLQEHKILKLDQILTCSWGYSVTVVNRTEKTVWIQPISRDINNNDGIGNGTAMLDMELNATDPVRRTTTVLKAFGTGNTRPASET